MRAYLLHVHTYMYTHPRARECFARTTLWGDCIATLLWLALAPSAWTFSVLSCVKKEKKKKEKRRKRDLPSFTFIPVDKNDVAAKRKKERAVIKSVTKDGV